VATDHDPAAGNDGSDVAEARRAVLDSHCGAEKCSHLCGAGTVVTTVEFQRFLTEREGSPISDVRRKEMRRKQISGTFRSFLAVPDRAADALHGKS
jgi:hypothetical protein